MVKKRRQLNAKVRPDWFQKEWKQSLRDLEHAKGQKREYIQDIEAYISPLKESDIVSVSIRAEGLSVNVAYESVEQLENAAEDAAWKLLNESLIWKLLDVKIDVAVGLPTKGGGLFRNAALLLCSAIALGCPEVRDWTAERIIALSELHSTEFSADKLNDFECLACHLAFNIVTGRQDSKWQESLGETIYSQLLLAESQEDAQIALTELMNKRAILCCETLMKNIPPFEWLPFKLFPMDVLAILKNRQFDIDKLDFGSWECPLCHPPEHFNWQKPDLVLRAEKAIEEYATFPEVDWA